MIKVTKYRELPVSVWKKVPFWVRVRHHYLSYLDLLTDDLKELLCLTLTLRELLVIPFRLIVFPVSGLVLARADASRNSCNSFIWYHTYNVHPRLINCKWSSTEYTREELGDTK